MSKSCLLIDISCPADDNIAMKLAEKLAKYNLVVEISRMWECRTMVVPVVLGALGTVHAGIFTVTGHYSRPSQLVALTKISASWIQLDPL